VLPNIQDLVIQGGPRDDDSDIGKLFHLVYVEIPHKMKTGLRPDTDREITMKEYFQEFPITLEALILMMFQTIPEYLLGEKENQNRLTLENQQGARRVSMQSQTGNGETDDASNGDTAVTKKKGGRPANKEGFVLSVFDKYRHEVDDRRDFLDQPGDKDDGYEEWIRRRDEGEFILCKKFYDKALAALNKKNRNARKRSFASVPATALTDTSHSETRDEDIQDKNPKCMSKYEGKVAKKYKKVMEEKRTIDQTVTSDDLRKMATDMTIQDISR
jgi:hypothetical protein